MDKAKRLFAGVCIAPIILMWILIFFFHETAWLIPFVAYLFILTSLAGESLVEKDTKMDKEIQTDRDCLKEQSTQTEAFLLSSSFDESGEVNEMTYGYGNGDHPLLTEICMATEELSSIEEISADDTDSDTPAQPFMEIPFPFKKRIKAVTATFERTKFLAETDPNFFKHDAEFMKYIKIEGAGFQYTLQRKLRKFKKFFSKK